MSPREILPDGAYIGGRYSPDFWIKDGLIYANEGIYVQGSLDALAIYGDRTDQPTFPNYSEWTEEQRAAKRAEFAEANRQVREEEERKKAEFLVVWAVLTQEQREAIEPFLEYGAPTL